MAEKGQEAAKKADDSHSPSQKYKGFGENAIEGYILGLQNKEGDLQSAMTDVLTNAAQVFEDSGDMMGEGFGNSLKSSMETSLAGVEAVVHSQLGGLTSTFASSFTQINVSGLQFGTTLKTAIQSSLTGVNSMAKSQLTSMLNSFSSNFTLIQTRTTSWGNNTKTNINNILSSVTGTVKSKLTTMASNFSSTYAAILSNQSSWGSNMQSSASSIISSVVNSMTSIMSTAISSFQNIGVQIVQGLWNGIASRDSWIRSNVASFVNGLVQAANNQLGIHSPSRVFMEMGAFSGEGYGIGLMNSLENVKKNLNSALQMVVPDLPQQKGVAEPTSSQSASGKTIVVNQTINSPRAINRLDIYRQTKNAVLLAGRDIGE